MSDTLTRLVVQIGADVADLKRGMADAQKSTSTFKDTYLAMTGAIASANLGSKVVDATKQAVSGFADLQQSVANISTIAPTIDTSKVFASLNEMQTRVPQTAAQLGDALYNVFSSVDVAQEDALKLVETFSRGAVGAATDAQTFGTAVMGVMNAYKLSASDAEHISDVFFNTVAKGVVTGQELASSLGPVTQAAKSAGVSLDELGGLIAGVTKEGGPAAQNINNLANFLSKINTADAQKALNDMGVATVDATGHFRPMTAVLTDLKGKLGGMTEAAKLNAIQAIFPDAQARQGAMTLISQLDNVKAAIDSNRSATGVAASAYEKMSQTWAAQSQLLQNSVSAALTQIAAQVLPSVTPFITAFAQQIPAALHTAGDAVEWVTKHWETLQPLLLAAAGAITAALLPAIVAWTAAAVANTAALTAQAAAAALAYAPLVALGAAAVIAGKGLYDLAKGFDAGKTKGEEFRATVAAFGQTAGKSYIETFTKMAAAHKPAIEQAQYFLAEQDKLVTQGRTYAGLATDQFLAIRKLGDAYGDHTKEIADATRQFNDYKLKGAEITAQQDALRDALQRTTGMTVQQAEALVRQAAATEQAAGQTAELKKKQDEHVTSASPFGAALLEIRDKAKSVSEAFDMAIKKIDEMAGRMTATEQVLSRQVHSLDAVGSSAQAAFSSQNADSIRFWADQAKAAAESAGLGEAPTARLDELIDAIARHTPGSAAALDALNKVVKDAKAPMDDANKAYADQRQLAGDLAKENLGLGGSLDALRQTLREFVDTFLLMMGRIPPGARETADETTKAFAIANVLQSHGLNAAIAFANGLRSGTRAVYDAASSLANQATGAFKGVLEIQSPSKVFIKLGEQTGEGFALGLLAAAGMAVAAAQDLVGSVIKVAAGAGKAPLGGTETPTPAEPAGANAALAAGFAASIAPMDAARTALRANQTELAATNARLLELHRELLNMGPHDANRKAVEDEIRQLQQTKSELQSAVTGYQALVKELNNGTTAAQGFTGAMAAIQQTQQITEQFGATGAAAISAFGDALSDDSPAAGAKAAQAANAVVAAARAAGVPGWEGLAAAQAEAWQRALEERTPEAIQAAIDATQAITDATKARFTLSAATFGEAFATAVNAQGIAEALGSSWASGFAALDKAWHEGGAQNIQAAAQWAAQVQQAIGTLPASLRDQIAPEWAAAVQEMIDNPSQDAEDRVKAMAARIHQASLIIPKNFKDLAPDVQQYILQLVQSVADGALSIEDATAQAGDAAKLIPAGFKRMVPELQSIINGYVLLVRSGAMDVTTAAERIADAQSLIPKNLHELTPAVQREIIAIVQAWQQGAISVEEAQRRITTAIEHSAKSVVDNTQVILSAFTAMTAAHHGLQQSFQFSASGPGGSTGSTTSIIQNFMGLLGLLQSTVTENGQTTTNFSFPQWLLEAYGNNIDAIMHDMAAGLGAFMDADKLKKWLDEWKAANQTAGATQTAAATSQATAAGQQGAAAAAQHSNAVKIADVTSEFTATGDTFQGAVDVATAFTDEFGTYVNDFGQVVDGLGQVVQDAVNPDAAGSDAERAAMQAELDARRRAWEKGHPGEPVPFARGAYIDQLTYLVNAQGKTYGKMAEAGPEYIVPAPQMQQLVAAAQATMMQPAGGSAGTVPKPAPDVQTYTTQWGDKMVRVYDANGWRWVPESLYQSSYLGAAATAMAAGHPASSALPAATGGAHSLLPTGSAPVVVNVYGDVFDTDHQFQKKVQQALASAQQRRY